MEAPCDITTEHHITCDGKGKPNEFNVELTYIPVVEAHQHELLSGEIGPSTLMCIRLYDGNLLQELNKQKE